MTKVLGLIQAKALPAKNTSQGKRPTWLIRAVDLERYLTPDGVAALKVPRAAKARAIDADVEKIF